MQLDCLKGRVVCRTVYGDISHGINHMSRILYPSPGFLSSATWPLMPKKHDNESILIIITPFKKPRSMSYV